MTIPEIAKLENMGEQLGLLSKIGEKRLTDHRLSAVCLVRIADGAKAHILSQLPVRRLIVASDSLAAQSLARRLESWGVRVAYLPARDDVLLPRKGFSGENVLRRVTALSNWAFGELDAIVTYADSLLQLFPARRLVERFTVRVKKEQIIAPQQLAKALAEAGYRRQETLGDVGDFTLRGDILDIYATDKNAYRVNFFDELIEDIKLIDLDSMLPVCEVESLIVSPCSDILLDERGYDVAQRKLALHINSKNAASMRSALSVGAVDSSCVWATPFMEGCNETLLDFLDGNEPFLVAFDEPKVVNEKLNLLSGEFESRLKPLMEAGEILGEHRNACISLNELRRELLLRRKLSVSSLSLGNPIFEPKLLLEPTTRAVTKYYLDPDSTARDIRTFTLNGAKVIFCAGDRERAKGIAESLRAQDIYGEISDDGNGSAPVQVTPLKIYQGAIYPKSGVVIIGVSECIGRRGEKSISTHNAGFTAPKAGDYVVHRVHGVGICEGTTLLKTGDFEREYIVLRYRDGDMLYVATDQMGNLQRFVGEKDPDLNKLGGKEFEREKERVRKSVRRMAINLVDLYAKREKQRGFKYSSDTVWQKEFEDDFEYEETADQLKAIADIKQDMEQGRIMDRLLVGDVGFGKTEVAFRAMFKTVLDGKQAVLVAPTTILVRQHYENLVKRLEPFGIKCAMLSRLQNDKQSDKIAQQLKDGSLYMVVATHKVLSKNIEFHDLGLIVLDEEQRFGVEHKEKLKERYPLVNVLTLSATPIPRTLNMSLTGIRDISMLETAPQGRLPVQTYVVTYSDALVADAVMRETARSGQTLILLNDINALDPFADRLRDMCNGVRVVTAHGQLPSSVLEEKIGAFYDKRYDVLVSTTIIENGIDLPDANTLIVIDSQDFGLAQLYQLRGRVGRRGALAHAYFTIPREDVLSGNAEKRLKTLLENTEIGSGFRVALADLAIRGAGTLLGAEQSGHIEKVGYEMYLELLDEAVQEIRTGVVAKPQREVEMKVDASAYIRDGYVSQRDKLRVYKQISSVNSLSARDALISELNEVYGAVDVPLKNLINISLLKNLAARLDVSRIVVNRNGAGASFYDADAFKNEALMRAVADNGSSVVLTNTVPPSLVFDCKSLTAERKLEKMIDFFASAQ